jgi:hypothetical protein
MLTTGIQNLPEPLSRAQAAYHDGTARLAPASADRVAQRVEYLELYADFGGEALTRYLGQVSGGDPPDAVGRAMVSALLDPCPRPGSRRVGPVRVVGHGPDDRELRPPGRPARAERSARLTGFAE